MTNIREEAENKAIELLSMMTFESKESLLKNNHRHIQILADELERLANKSERWNKMLCDYEEKIKSLEAKIADEIKKHSECAMLVLELTGKVKEYESKLACAVEALEIIVSETSCLPINIQAINKRCKEAIKKIEGE